MCHRRQPARRNAQRRYTARHGNLGPSTWSRKLAYVVPIPLRYPRSEGTTNLLRPRESGCQEIGICAGKNFISSSPRKRRAVRGNYLCNDNWRGAHRNRSEVVLRGLDPRIHVFVSGARRRGWPGQARPRRDQRVDLLRYPAARFSPDSPARKREPRDFNHLPWAPAFAGATIGECFQFDYTLVGQDDFSPVHCCNLSSVIGRSRTRFPVA